MTTTRLYMLTAACLAMALLNGLAPAASDGPSASSSTSKPAELSQPAPNFSLNDCFGKLFSITEFKGKIVVLEWLNQNCPVSRGAHEKMKMQNIYKKYADKGVIWLGIDSTAGATAEGNRVYAARMGIAYPILLDPNGKVGHSFQAKRTPHMFVIDKTGKLVYTGAIDDQKDKNYIVAAIEDLIANRPVAKPKTEPYGCGIKYAQP